VSFSTSRQINDPFKRLKCDEKQYIICRPRLKEILVFKNEFALYLGQKFMDRGS